jgi:hypothetical protein
VTQVGNITPVPTDEEAAVVVAAIEALWPKPVLAAPLAPADIAPKWRFSGRWWSRPIPSRRMRPW